MNTSWNMHPSSSSFSKWAFGTRNLCKISTHICVLCDKHILFVPYSFIHEWICTCWQSLRYHMFCIPKVLRMQSIRFNHGEFTIWKSATWVLTLSVAINIFLQSPVVSAWLNEHWECRSVEGFYIYYYKQFDECSIHWFDVTSINMA